MFAKITSFGVRGLAGFAVTAEADISGGLPSLTLVGLPDSAVKESADRVRSASKNLGYGWPSRITLNLAPADIKKTGPVYDLPLLLALLAAQKKLPAPAAHQAFIGELSLDGSLRPVNGVLPMALCAAECGITEFFVPSSNAAEAAAAPGLTVFPADTAAQVVDHLCGNALLRAAQPLPYLPTSAQGGPDFSDVHGQLQARRAMEIAAAGGHNILLIGPPGSGKTLLAQRLPGILPPLSTQEAVEVTKIYSVAGLLPAGSGLIGQRPFRSPHHSVSPAALAGGGSNLRPGEVSLAHNGVLFLDELPEFSRDALEVLRQPIEDGIVTVSRVSGTAVYPSRMMLVAAMNPCKCGYFGHPTRPCTCTPSSIQRYRQRISGPLLDRIDLHVDVPPVDYDDLTSSCGGECSQDIRTRVLAARAIQQQRYHGTNILCNAQLPTRLLRRHCRMSNDAEALLRAAFSSMGLSARAYDRILKVSRTIADLAGMERIESAHIAEALQYRSLDRNYWYEL